MYMKIKHIVLIGISILLIIIFWVLFYLFFADTSTDTPPIDTGGFAVVDDDLGLSALPDTPNPQQIDINPGIGFDDGVVRDDRVYTPPAEGGGVVSQEGEEPRLIRLFAGPTAGYRIDREVDGWVVRVIEQGRGNRYIISPSPYSLNLVSSGEFTKVVEGHIFSNDSTLILYESRDAENIIRSAFVEFAPLDGSGTIQWFENNIRATTNNKTLLFFTQIIDERLVGLVVDVENPEKTNVVWKSDFTNWHPHWGRNSHITLTSPITNALEGYIYLIDPDGEEPINRFIDISSGGGVLIDTSSGFFVLYTAAEADEIVGKTSITDQNRKTVIDMPTTLPEKCDGFNGVFVCAIPNIIPTRTRSGYETIFPDSWYQGDISFSDSVVLIDAVSGDRKLILSPDHSDFDDLSGGSVFDIIHPRISEDGKYLFFVNKIDRSLWMLHL